MERTTMKRLAAVLASMVSILGFAFTANGYRPLTKSGYGSMYAFSYGVFASELPLQTLAIQWRRGCGVALVATADTTVQLAGVGGVVAGVCWVCATSGTRPTSR